MAGAMLGWWASQGGFAGEPALLMLLRFMAVVKGGLVLAAAGAAMWRLRRHDTGMGPVFAYAVPCGVMAVGIAPIWAGTQVAMGAVAVHAGLVAYAVVAWRDRAGWR